MKILQINASYKPAYIYGGPTMSVSALSEHLARAGHLVSVYTTTANGKTELPVTLGNPIFSDGVEVTYFKRVTKDHSHFSPALLAQVWRTVKQYDVVHIHAWWNLVSVGTCLISRLRRVPVVVSPRGTLSLYTFSYKNSYLKRLTHEIFGRRLLNRCAIHVTSGHEKKGIKLLLQPKQIAEISNFVAIPAEPPPLTEPAGKEPFRLLFLSRIDAKKGIDILIDALALTSAPYRLTIAGDGNENYIRSLQLNAERKGIKANIHWAGFAGGDRKFDLLAQHHLMVLPSYDENFGNVVIESLSVGTPVLISTHVGLSSYVAKNNLGWICDNDAQAISNAITEIRNDIERQDNIRRRAPQQIKKDFAPDVLVNQYIELYNSIT